MKILKKLSALTILISVLFSLNAFAMDENYNFLYLQPSDDQKSEENSQDYNWTWLKDDLCIRFLSGNYTNKSSIQRQYDMGVARTWRNKTINGSESKTRETYSGKWSQSEDGTRSFTFDDCTIPVGVTKIDGVLYAFNGYGELKAGYEYYTGFKTEADGLVKADNAEFTQWLGTQYLPDCTSHE